MALKQILLQRKINDSKKILETLREKDLEFKKREADLETAIGEAVNDEEKNAVEDEVNKFQAEKEPHDGEV